MASRNLHHRPADQDLATALVIHGPHLPNEDSPSKRTLTPSEEFAPGFTEGTINLLSAVRAYKAACDVYCFDVKDDIPDCEDRLCIVKTRLQNKQMWKELATLGTNPMPEESVKFIQDLRAILQVPSEKLHTAFLIATNILEWEVNKFIGPPQPVQRAMP